MEEHSYKKELSGLCCIRRKYGGSGNNISKILRGLISEVEAAWEWFPQRDDNERSLNMPFQSLVRRTILEAVTGMQRPPGYVVWRVMAWKRNICKWFTRRRLRGCLTTVTTSDEHSTHCYANKLFYFLFLLAHLCFFVLPNSQRCCLNTLQTWFKVNLKSFKKLNTYIFV